MSRTVPVLLACVAAMGCPALKPTSSGPPATPAPGGVGDERVTAGADGGGVRDGEPVAYMPTTVGDKWVTVYRRGKTQVEETHEVTAVERKSGGVYITAVRNRMVSKYKASRSGLFLLENGGRAYDPPA